jgi:predicted transcriptional regulator
MKTATTTNIHAMTLRLPPQIAHALESTAYELCMSQSAFVRRAIREAIEHAQAHELPVVRRQEARHAVGGKRNGNPGCVDGGNSPNAIASDLLRTRHPSS